ncbi:ribonuclease HII [Thermomicrobium sp. CFH 73360]|uniref:ribonuclease HII n=1 Tax=Thermomicrobium sp. CFH 73360 TaxID=2951987 RepID=UPI002076AD78|nr:ribonuclease HII [Thermomicrobium sp. CFH 73360]MCM8744933.1 ribonuclease HII [Thermomicrobium sp. CFH 73360]
MSAPLVSSSKRQSGRDERPTFKLEQELWQAGKVRIAGLDEVGRGALAGPVVAAACVFAPGTTIPDLLSDSKRLTPRQRARLAEWIRSHATAWALGAASHREIDRYGIVVATALAMHRAVARLGPIDHVLYDGLVLPGFDSTISTAIVGGDCLCASIAAASILAKVTRDRLMGQLARFFPEYGWEDNAGYGTSAHRQAIARFGLTPLHRGSFRIGIGVQED